MAAPLPSAQDGGCQTQKKGAALRAAHTGFRSKVQLQMPLPLLSTMDEIDYLGDPVPDGVYYIALWLDPNGFLAESNEINNASLSWGTIQIGTGRGVGSGASATSSVIVPGEAYNGKTLPARQASVRRVRISSTPERERRMESLDEGAAGDAGPRGKMVESPRWSKVARARQQVTFPATEAKPMPAGK